jgi:xylulose-5-phosphate/fructose-6-phosphate phosphoketolase
VADTALRSTDLVNVIVIGKQEQPQYLDMDAAVKHCSAGIGIWPWVPDLKVRVVNVVDLMTLQPPSEHPHGLADREFDAIFTRDKPIIFAYHGYPWLIHRLTYRRTNHANLHVRGYKEEGTTTTPFDMVVRNDLDRFHLVGDVVDRVPKLAGAAAYTRQFVRDKLVEHREYIHEHGQDMPEIRAWHWQGDDIAAG